EIGPRRDSAVDELPRAFEGQLRFVDDGLRLLHESGLGDIDAVRLAVRSQPEPRTGLAKHRFGLRHAKLVVSGLDLRQRLALDDLAPEIDGQRRDASCDLHADDRLLRGGKRTVYDDRTAE